MSSIFMRSSSVSPSRTARGTIRKIGVDQWVLRKWGKVLIEISSRATGGQ